MSSSVVERSVGGEDPLFPRRLLSEAEVSPFVVRRPTFIRRRKRTTLESALIRRSYSSREVSRGKDEEECPDDRRESGLRSAEDLLQDEDSSFQMLTHNETSTPSGKTRSSSASLFKTFGLKRTLTMNSIISNINKSFRFRRRTQSCRQDKTPRNSSYSSGNMMSSSELSSSTPLTSGSSHRKIFDSSRSRVRGLSNIDPKFTSQSGLCTSTDLETSRGSIRIQHLTALSNETVGSSRFPKIDHCAHFHYEFTEISGIQIELLDEEEELRSLLSSNESGSISDTPNSVFSIQVTSLGKTWSIKRSIEDFYFLDKQTHTCIWDRKFSRLPQIPRGEENFKVPTNYSSHKDSVRGFFSDYIRRFSTLAGPVITCGPVLNWFDLDNRGHRLIVSEDCAINTPAVAAAYAVKRYAKQASDEISFEVGDMISVIDMPPPDESIWWRGKRGFEVGFFPCECVEVIGDKVPSGLNLPGANLTSPAQTHQVGVGGPPSSSNSSAGSEDDEEDVPDGVACSPSSEPTKPVLRKHGKLISFFRSFILSRPTRGKLKKSGILKERVFGCDLSEHLMNTAQEIPKVLFHCAEFIETKGIIDGIYRLSGIASNIQKLRVTFDEDRVPDLHNDRSVLQDIHCVSSLLKMYFRELPNPICTYHLYEKFVEAAKSSENQRLVLLRDVVQQLPPPNYRTLEYLSRHLYRVSLRGNETGMTAKNVAIVWAPNLLRSKSLEVGGVAALQGVGVQAVVTEYLIRYCELIFSEKIPSSVPPYNNSPSSGSHETPKKSRPKSLAISTPTKLLSLEEARSRALTAASAASGSYATPEQRYIEVGGGPNNLPPTYHTVIDLPGSNIRKITSERGSTRQQQTLRKSPVGWKTIFAPGKIKYYKSNNKISDSELLPNNCQDEPSSTSEGGSHRVISATTSLVVGDSTGSQDSSGPALRPAKSAESLVLACSETSSQEFSRPNSGEVKDEIVPLETVTLALLKSTAAARESPKTHSRSSSHDSYFERRTPLPSTAVTPLSSSKPSSSVMMDSESPLDPKSSSLDLSEIQVNFELEENEMKIFSEDEDALMSTSFTSIDEEEDEDVRPSFRRISSRQQGGRTVKIPPKCQIELSSSPLLPPLFFSAASSEVSPKKKKSDFTPGTSPNSNLVKRSKMEPQHEERQPSPSSLPMSPSIKFIDDRPPSPLDEVGDEPVSEEHSKESSDQSKPEESKDPVGEPAATEEEEETKKRLSKISSSSTSESESSTNDMLNEGNLDKLVIAEVYSSPPFPASETAAAASSLLCVEEEIDQEEPSICTVKEISLNAEENSELTKEEEPGLDENNESSCPTTNSQEESSYISSPTESTSYSIAGATVSENESFSLTSFEDDFKSSDEFSPPKSLNNSNSVSHIVYSTSEVRNEEAPLTYTSEEIFIRPFTHESVVAMEIDEDSNITFLPGMEVEEEELMMTAVPVQVLEDEDDDDLGHFDYQPIQTTSCSSSSSGGKASGAAYLRSNSMEADGRMSSIGIPELEAGNEPSLLLKASLCKSEDFPKKLSKRSPSKQPEEGPLVRRNSIHNVPYVDVNDPGTRERMERYKEERRSLLRAKYKAEDYRIPQNGSFKKTTRSNENESSKPKRSEDNKNNDPEQEDHSNRQANENSLPSKKPPLSPTRSTTSTSSSYGLINEEVNVRERAALFGSKEPPGGKDSIKRKSSFLSLSSRSNNTHPPTNTHHLDKSPVSPNKIKNIAALFEQKS